MIGSDIQARNFLVKMERLETNIRWVLFSSISLRQDTKLATANVTESDFNCLKAQNEGFNREGNLFGVAAS